MSKLSNPLFVLLISFFLTACHSYQPVHVRHVTSLEVGHGLQGFYYALPRTVISIDFTVLKTQEFPGPFAQYAGKYLGLDNVITQSITHYSISDINISSYAEPDPNEFYFAEYNPKTNKKNSLSFSFSESGIITNVNSKFDNEGFLENNPDKRAYGYFGTEATFNQFIETNLQERIDTIVERVRMDTITIERQTLRRSWVEKSSEVRAREVADYILKIRNKKFDLISGFAEITYSRDAIKYMHDQLDAQEIAYLELFTGITTTSKINYRFTVLPEKELADREQILFYFSETEGLLTEPKRGSDPVSVETSRQNTTRQMAVFTQSSANQKNAQHGFFYRIPEHGQVNVKRRNNTLAEARMLINQFGIITSLPAQELNIEFYPSTGSIKTVGKNSDD